MQKHISLFILIFTFNISFAQKVFKVDDVPNPKEVDNTFISDPTHILQENTIDIINQKLQFLEDSTTDQIAVVILPSIGNVEIETFATELFQKFGIGQSETYNGLLILLVMDQRKVKFETGYGLEEYLPDGVCKTIQMKTMIPQFKNGNYDHGLMDGIDEIIQILYSKTIISNQETSEVYDKNYESETTKSVKENRDRLFLILSIMLGTMLFFMFFEIKRKGRFNEFKLKNELNKDIIIPISVYTWFILCVITPILLGLFLYFNKSPHAVLEGFASIYLYFLIIMLNYRYRTFNVFKQN